MWWTHRQQVSVILTIYAVGLVLFILFHWESVLCGTVPIDFLPFHSVHPMSLVSSYLFMVWFRLAVLVFVWWMFPQNQCSCFVNCDASCGHG